MTRGERFLLLRQLLGPWPGKPIPQKRLAAMLGVVERTVRRYETGEAIGGEQIDRLVSVVARSEVQGFTLDWLLVGVGEQPTRTWPTEPIPGATGPERLDTKYLELDDLLRTVGLRAPALLLSNEAACELLNAAEMELMRIDNAALREELAIEIVEWRETYGCEEEP